MKIGMRKPSIKKSISARTTGKIKRQVKSAVNPMYGNKGTGVVTNPEKAIYNKVYNKTTFGVSDVAEGLTSGSKKSAAYEPDDFTETFIAEQQELKPGLLGKLFGITKEDLEKAKAEEDAKQAARMAKMSKEDLRMLGLLDDDD